jgi:hypothetical protein
MDQLVEWNTIGSPPYDTFVKIQDLWLYAVVFGQDANIKRGSAEQNTPLLDLSLLCAMCASLHAWTDCSLLQLAHTTRSLLNCLFFYWVLV